MCINNSIILKIIILKNESAISSEIHLQRLLLYKKRQKASPKVFQPLYILTHSIDVLLTPGIKEDKVLLLAVNLDQLNMMTCIGWLCFVHNSIQHFGLLQIMSQWYPPRSKLPIIESLSSSCHCLISLYYKVGIKPNDRDFII